MQKMAARVGAGRVRLEVGDIVQVAIPEVDRGRADGTSLTCVVVQVTDSEMYRLATHAGVIKVCYHRGDLSHITEGTLRGLHLELALKDWRQMVSIPLRAAAVAASFTGGQGMVKCGCGGVCGGRCTCRKASRLCNSRCHAKNPICGNCE